jgi:hypothetical protein
MADNATPTLPVRRPKWLRRSGILALFCVFLAGAIYISLPPVARWQIETQLGKLGAKSVEVGRLSINPATGEIEVENFKSVGPDGEDILVGKAKLRISLPDLARRQITISELSVSDADIDIRHDEKGLWSVGGFPMAFAAAEEPPEPSPPWQLEADNISVDDSEITLNLMSGLQKALFEELRINKLSTLTPTEPATISLSVTTSGGKVVLDGTALPFAAKPGAELLLNVPALKLAAFRDLIANGRIKDIDGTATVQGKASAGIGQDGGISISFNGKASLATALVRTTLFETSAKSLTWDGNADASLPGANAPIDALPTMDIKGKASASDFSFRNLVSELSLSATSAGFDLTKSGVTILEDPKKIGTTLIRSEVTAKLSNARFDQPETGLTVAPEEINLTGKVELTLPPKTAALSAKLSGVVDAKALSGALETAGIDRLDAKSFRITYKDAVIDLSAQGALSGDVAGGLALTGVALDAPRLGLRAAATSLDSSENRISFSQTEAGGMKLSLTGGLTANGVSSESVDKSWTVGQQKAVWSGTIGLDPTSGDSPADGLSLSGDIELTGFDAFLAAEDPFRVKLATARAKGVAVAPSGSSIEEASIGELSTSGATDASNLPRIGLKSLLLTGIRSDKGGGLGVDAVRAFGFSGKLVRKTDGEISLPKVPESKNAETQSSASTAAPVDKAVTIRIGSAVLADSKLEFEDNSVTPPFLIETSGFEASLQDFDTARPATDAGVNVLLGLGQFGRVQIDGSVKPDLDNATAELGIGFKNIELFKFNAYILPAIKHTIRQGRADGDIALKLTDSRIDAQTTLTISRLEVAPAPERKDGRIVESGPPIETALGLIQNDQGIMKLSIPITGSLDDPRFDLTDAVGQAISGAMQKTLLTAVKIAFPLGAVVAIVDSVGTPRISIKPLEFTAGSSELTPVLKNRIAEIAVYLKKKPKEAPSMCAPATASDLEALTKTTPTADRETAINLATSRITAVRDELVSEHGISAERIFVCAPTFVEAADRVPSVTVDLKN